MLTELATSLALVGSGMGIGKTSEAAFRMLVLKNCPKLLAFASEIGIDATMSLVADYAITGQIDLSGEGIAQLQSILVGVLHAKGNFKTYINTHAGDISPKKKTSNPDVPKRISHNTVENFEGSAYTNKKLDKISDRFEKLKSKNLDEYNVEKYDDNAKQILLDIAKIDSENEKQVEAFLKNHPEFVLESQKTVFPSDYDSDGFFIVSFYVFTFMTPSCHFIE